MRTLYNTSLITESQAFLKSMNSWCNVLFTPIFSPVFDECKKSDPEGGFAMIMVTTDHMDPY
jgi:hypothetical protein